jgi:hypothetical protein
LGSLRLIVRHCIHFRLVDGQTRDASACDATFKEMDSLRPFNPVCNLVAELARNPEQGSREQRRG